MLSQAEKGGVQNTIQNCVTVLQNDPILADSIRLNLLSERIDIVKPMGWQRSGPTRTDTDKLTFSPDMQEALQICQKDFMQEDTQAGMIYAFLEDYTGDRVCSKQLYAEALGNLNLPAEWETRAICEIMTAGIANGEIKGWTAHKAAKRYPKYGVQKGWERVTAAKVDADGFVELTDKEAQQMGFPF